MPSLAATSRAISPGDPTCWIGGFSEAQCCGMHYGLRGNLGCWDAQYTFERCCPSLPSTAEPAPLPSPAPPRNENAADGPPMSDQGLRGLLAANMQGPNGEGLSLIPAQYAQAGIAAIFVIWSLVWGAPMLASRLL